MKNLIAITILLIGGIAAYYFLVNKKTSFNATEEYKDFAIEDTASVTKIFMSKPNGQKILLSRTNNGEWMVNNSFAARKDAIHLILKTLHDVQILGNVAADKFDHVVRRISTDAIKVEYYTGNEKPEKTWYIGDPTESKIGTYMLLEKNGVKSKSPYATHLLMERGFLSTRFFLDEELWRERYLLRSEPKKLRSIKIEFTKDLDTSYKITQLSSGQFLLTDLKNGLETPLLPSVAIPFFKEFGTIYYEYIDQTTPQEELDSIYSVFPKHTITLETQDGQQHIVKTYNMPVQEGSQVDGVSIDAHPERMYAFSSQMDNNYFPVVQNFAFDKLVPSISTFKSSTTVEK